MTTEEPVLTEAQNYEAMFTPLWSMTNNLVDEYPQNGDLDDKVKKFKDSFPGFIQVAKNTLKKNDKIVWFLKLIRLAMAADIYNKTNFGEIASRGHDDVANNNLNVLDAFINKAKSELSMTHVNNARIFTLANLIHMSESLAHYFSLPIPEIQNTVFTNQNPSELLGKFSELEREWKDKQNQILKHTPEEESMMDTIIKFPDGKMWVNLNRPHCSAEGKAMGHCGNTASPQNGDNVLSLREPIKQGNEIKWRPLLTFILHKNGFLGEMKGRGNQKPAPQYHNEVIELLKLPIIKGIQGGGYAPERNFAITDLSDKEQDALVEFKPGLGSIAYQFKRFGMTPELIQNIHEKADSLGISGASSIPYDANSQMFQVSEMPLKDFIGEYAPGSDDRRGSQFRRRRNSLEYAFEIVMSEKTLDTYDWVQNSDIKSLIENLPVDLETGLIAYCKSAYPNEFDEAGDYTGQDVYELLRENDDEMADNFRTAVTRGYESGTYSEIYNALIGCLRNWSAHGFHLQFENSEDGQHILIDNPVKLVIKAKDLIDNLSNADYCADAEESGNWLLREVGPELNEPHYGWNSYDEKSALDSLREETDLPELAKKANIEAKESINYFKKKI